MDLEIRMPTEEEYEKWISTYLLACGFHATEAVLSRRPWMELDRLLAAYDDGLMVGTTATSSLEMSIPGGVLPTGLVGVVGVPPTHRRRGILTKLMKRQFRDIHERGEPLATLEASESIIYGRFGFGIGALGEDWSIERQHTAFGRSVEPRGRVRFMDPAEAKRVYPILNNRVSAHRSGIVRYRQAFWDFFLRDTGYFASGITAFFHVVYGGDEPDGCASYRIRDKRLTVRYLIAATDDAYAALWSFLLNVDLMASFHAEGRAIDEALPWMLADPRRLNRSVRDESWVRVVDVEAALSARRYARDGRLKIEVRDPTCPWNDRVWELEGGPDGASCRPTRESPDLVLSASELGAVYLGGDRFTPLLGAGRIEELTAGAVETADSMFATRLQPWSYC